MLILTTIKMPTAILNAAKMLIGKMLVVEISIVKKPIIEMSIVTICTISFIVHFYWGRQTFPEPHSCTLKIIVYQKKLGESVIW